MRVALSDLDMTAVEDRLGSTDRQESGDDGEKPRPDVKYIGVEPIPRQPRSQPSPIAR